MIKRLKKAQERDVEFNMDCMTISTFRNLEQQAIRQRYNEIYAHELAHKNAGGSMAGAIVIEKGANGVPIGGHVSIKMPSLNPQNPDETIKQANVVISAALAPSNPSSQDYNVASKACAIKAKAENIKTNKGLDYYA